MSKPEKKEDESSTYIPEYTYYRDMIELGAPKIIRRLVNDPVFLPIACVDHLRSTEDENYVVSPLLIDHIMMILWIGSRGETAAEIRNSLRHKNLTIRELRRGAKALLHLLWNQGTYDFFPANKIYVRALHTIDMNFKIMSEGAFYIYVELLNLQRRVRSTNKINGWIENQTYSAVQGLIAPNLLTPSCKIVIVSSVYFRACWHVDIDRRLTSWKEFMVRADRVVEAEFMHTLFYYNYYESIELRAKFLELKLRETEGSLVIILPTKQYSVTPLEDNLRQVLTVPESDFKTVLVKAEVPKFIISTTRDWKHGLQELGINRLFTDQAEISTLAGNPDDLRVDHIVQKIVIRFDEQGAETTTVFLGQKENPEPSPDSGYAKKFIANHPFLFYVKIRGVIVYIGRLVDPSNSEDVL